MSTAKKTRSFFTGVACPCACMCVAGNLGNPFLLCTRTQSVKTPKAKRANALGNCYGKICAHLPSWHHGSRTMPPREASKTSPQGQPRINMGTSHTHVHTDTTAKDQKTRLLQTFPAQLRWHTPATPELQEEQVTKNLASCCLAKPTHTTIQNQIAGMTCSTPMRLPVCVFASSIRKGVKRSKDTTNCTAAQPMPLTEPLAAILGSLRYLAGNIWPPGQKSWPTSRGGRYEHMFLPRPLSSPRRPSKLATKELIKTFEVTRARTTQIHIPRSY